MENLRAELRNLFTEMSDIEIVTIWNDYCNNSNNYDDEVYTMDMLEDIFSGQDYTRILNRFFFGNDEGREGTSANQNRNYFYFNGYGNVVSFDYIYNQFSDEFFAIDIDDLIDYIIENEESFDNDDIEELLESLEEDEEE